MDFLDYWDTRIDANERFFNNYPHIANFAFSECQELWDHKEEERKALLTRHTALVEAVVWERECIRQLDYAGKFWEDNNIPGRELIMILDAARAEVDRLIGGE